MERFKSSRDVDVDGKTWQVISLDSDTPSLDILSNVLAGLLSNARIVRKKTDIVIAFCLKKNNGKTEADPSNLLDASDGSCGKQFEDGNSNRNQDRRF